MFIKIYKRDNKTHYLLNIVDVNKKDVTNFISCFIPEELAKLLIDAGVSVKDKSKESK